MIIHQSCDKSSNLKSAYNDYQYNRYNQNIFTGLFWCIFNPVIVVLRKQLTGNVPSKSRTQRLKLCIFVNKTFKIHAFKVTSAMYHLDICFFNLIFFFLATAYGESAYGVLHNSFWKTIGKVVHCLHLR